MINLDFLQNPLISPFPTRSSKNLSLSLKFSFNRLYRQNFRHFRSSGSRSNPNFKVIHAEDSDRLRTSFSPSDDGFLGISDSDLPVELCFTQTLPPALTFEDAAGKIKEAIEKLKSNPPCSGSGILRFQVAVPPNVKALNWLLSQPHSHISFPQFYLSGRQLENLDLHSIPFDGLRAVSGIGSSVHFTGSSSQSSIEFSSIKRYLSVGSPLIKAYGIINIKYAAESLSPKHDMTSSYYFIPQVELNEFESSCILAATLAWDNSLSYTFKKAVMSLELSLCQATYNSYPIRQISLDKWITNAREKLELMEVENAQMVCLTAHALAHKDAAAHLLQLVVPTSWQFYFRLSMNVVFTSNMSCGPSGFTYSAVQGCANINALWASLIIEECSRLGLTYFCIAPGSRSSPLAVAASAHHLITCVSCYDERSLAFHAVGYGRGSHVPAVVITSSGTAVSNLLPAVVEASQDFVPLLLLTADRPPELLNVGANQAINQVNHFGSFARFFFGLPPPTDQIPARMVLTTVGSALHLATQAPQGPVHINCSFREPLEDTPKEWSSSCLKGLDLWMSSLGPFTKYLRTAHLYSCENIRDLDTEVLAIIQCANQGILLIGAIDTEVEIWAALLLAKHLRWPVVADILSGLRLRRISNLYHEVKKNIIFIDHLDHALLSQRVMGWARPDVVLQVGSRITSKRIAEMLELCCTCSYIMVDKHPYRHDPSHIVTHRIQSTITEFTSCLLKVQFPRKISNWSSFLQALNMMVAREISFQIRCQLSLTEPHVAQVISEALTGDAALFIGNSMVVRDVDMYGRGWVCSTVDNASRLPCWGLPCLGIRVAGNRGASGIDGLLSTAIGFAVGCKKRVYCLIGDISFLHDTNGLAILNQRTPRKPMTIVVINNHGGAIFSLLPIAKRTGPSVMNQYFYTAHNISVSKLCEAHSVKHLQVQTKVELQQALLASQLVKTDCLIEVESCIEDNATFHRILTNSARQVADDTLRILSRLSSPVHVSSGAFFCRINTMKYSLYRIQLCAPLTSAPFSNYSDGLYKEGFIITLSIEDGSVGLGEIAPIEIHKEDLLDVEEQLRYLLHVIRGAEISYDLPLLSGSFSSWIWTSLGIPPSSIFPSVRCGLEMAILNALAKREACSLSDIILGSGNLLHQAHLCEADKMKRSPGVQICALIDSNGSPKEVAYVVAQLVEEGFTTMKLKVARRGNILEDATIIQEIRKKVGYQVKLRVDANRTWTYDEAIQFGSLVKCCDLQYIEEPVQSEDDIIKFCNESGLPVALDETVDNIQGDFLKKLAEFVHPRIVAIVIKPSVVGGFENAALIAKWAQQHDKMAVVSGAFESSLSLAAYVQFAYYLEKKNSETCRMKNKENVRTFAHGLGTYRWLRQDVTTLPLKICVHPDSEMVEASVKDAAWLLHNFQINHDTVQRSNCDEKVKMYQLTVDCDNFSCSLNGLETGDIQKKVIIFLHGFLGTGEEWVPIMKALSATARCIAIDLPGHGKSKLRWLVGSDAKQGLSLSMEQTADLLLKVVEDIMPAKVTLVGYSMGARIALYLALKCSDKIDGAVIISGSPGLSSEVARRTRISQDDAKGSYLKTRGLECFLDLWYSSEMWNSLREHPHYEQIIGSRKHEDVNGLANALSELSVGRQPSLWEYLKHSKRPLLFIVGEKDTKFKEIAWQMCNKLSHKTEHEGDLQEKIHEMVVEIPGCGHAVHLENPLPVITSVRKFLSNQNY